MSYWWNATVCSKPIHEAGRSNSLTACQHVGRVTQVTTLARGPRYQPQVAGPKSRRRCSRYRVNPGEYAPASSGLMATVVQGTRNPMWQPKGRGADFVSSVSAQRLLRAAPTDRIHPKDAGARAQCGGRKLLFTGRQVWFRSRQKENRTTLAMANNRDSFKSETKEGTRRTDTRSVLSSSSRGAASKRRIFARGSANYRPVLGRWTRLASEL